jgi:hypothetical protein
MVIISSCAASLKNAVMRLLFWLGPRPCVTAALASRGRPALVFRQERESSARIRALPFFPASPSHLALVAIRTWEIWSTHEHVETAEEVQS